MVIDEPKEFYTIPGVLQRSSIQIDKLSHSTVWKWCQDGLIPHLKLGKTLYLSLDDFENFLKSKIQQPN